MSSADRIIGRPLNAVLTPPQAARFAAVTGADLDALAVNVTGWNKLVLLDRDRAFLFPRAADNVAWFERELVVYQALASTNLTVVPRLLDRWVDWQIYPFPFAAVTRLRGEVPAVPDGLFEQLGQTIAVWHEVPAPPELAGARPPRHLDAPHHHWLRRALNPPTSRAAAAEAADRLGRPDRDRAWAELLAAAAELVPVLVHGDIHEDQLLANGSELTGITDWETARVDHPFWDFDLGEWGTGLWRRRRRDFGLLWARCWRAYAEVRGLSTDSRPLETAFRLRHALLLVSKPGDPAVVGTVGEQLARL